jgi:hypothetical protein
MDATGLELDDAHLTALDGVGRRTKLARGPTGDRRASEDGRYFKVCSLVARGAG